VNPKGWIKAAIPLLILILLPSIGLGLTIPRTEAQQAQTAMSKRIEWMRIPIEAVPMALGSQIDIYLFGLRPVMAIDLAKRPDVALYQAAAGLLDLGLNPAPVMVLKFSGSITAEEVARRLNIPVEAVAYVDFNKDENVSYIDVCLKPPVDPKTAGFDVERDVTDKLLVNPLCFRQVRFALNYVVDREFIVREILRGFGIPMYTHYSPADPTYTVLVDLVARYKFTYDPDYAKQLVSDIMTKIGATMVGGYWQYGGKPITVTFIIRQEDERRDIGYMVANEIEKLGIKVERVELAFGEAIARVYGTDPMEFQWHIYTEGWGRGALDRWDPGMLTQFAAPWYGWMPGWQEAGYWQYKNATIDELSQLVSLGKFKSKEEFIDAIRGGTEMAIQESVRIWIAARLDTYAAIKDVMGVTLDMGAGLRNTIFNARNWYIPGRDTIRVGHLWVWTSRTAWNTFGGFSDVYSVDPMRTTWDPVIWRHPFNGEPMFIRATAEVKTAGPDGKLDVPPDAIRWDPEKGWVQVGPDKKATSVVIFDLSKLIGYQWHHGVSITWTDILGYLALLFDAVYNSTKANVEPKIASTNKIVFDTIVAFRPLTNENKLEVYVDYWHFDPMYIADYAAFGFTVPFEIELVQAYLGYDKQTYALTDTRAAATKLPWLSLVLSGHAKDVRAALLELRDMYDYAAKYVNVPGVYTLSRDEWNARIDAAVSWIDTYGIAWISNGPFKLVYYSSSEQKLVLERFEPTKYPIPPSQLYFGLPKPNSILEVTAPMVSPGGDLLVTVRVSGVFPLTVFYMISDPATREILYTGTTTTSREEVRILIPGSVTAKMKEYSYYEFTVLVWSESVVQPAERSIVLATGLRVGAISELEQRIANLSQSLAQLSNALAQLRAETMEATIKAVSEGFANVSQAIVDMGRTIANETSVIKSKVEDLSREAAPKSAVEDLSSSVQDLKSATATLNTTVTILLAVSIINLALGAFAVIRRR